MVIKKRTVILIALAILVLGLVGTGLSTLYEQSGYTESSSSVIFRVSYGFPLSWHGYSQNYTIQKEAARVLLASYAPLIPYIPPKIYWFSLESLVLDAVFWFAISFFVCVAAIKSVRILRKARASKMLSAINPVVVYFFASLSFLVAGLCLSSVNQAINIYLGPPPPNFEFLSHPYLDLGLRLYGIGMFLVVCTFYQSLLGERRTSQRLFKAHTSSNSI